MVFQPVIINWEKPESGNSDKLFHVKKEGVKGKAAKRELQRSHWESLRDFILLILLNEGQVLVDVIRGADHEGNPLVERLRLNVQHPLGAGGGEASGLLDEESDGVTLVQQTQL